MIVDKTQVWKLTNVVRVGLAPRSSHSQRQDTFPDNNTGEGVKGKKVRTTSDDAGGKSVSEKSKSTGGKCG